MSDERSLTRRGLIALAGGVAMAGCGALPNPLNPSPPRLDGARLSEIASGAVPSIPRRVPVAVAPDHVEEHAARARTLLGDAPLPFDERELPNGAMRERLNETARAVREDLDTAADAPTPFEAVGTLRVARGRARTVAAAWAYADDGLRREDLTGDADALAGDVAAFRDRRSYVGEDPVRAVLVHDDVETLASEAAADVDGDRGGRRGRDGPANLVTVSEYAGALERGRAALADAAYLYDRLRADLSETHDLGPAFESALDELLDTLHAETADLSDDEPVSALVDADVESSPVSLPLQYLHSDVTDLAPVVADRDRGAVATGIVAAHRELTRLGAFADLRTRVEGGETYEVRDESDVAALRAEAVDAVETALRETNHPGLSRRVLGNLCELVEHADDELTYDDDDVPVDWLRRDLGEYVYVAVVARATPEASERVAAALTD